jgi:hypothetical protein
MTLTKGLLSSLPLAEDAIHNVFVFFALPFKQLQAHRKQKRKQ